MNLTHYIRKNAFLPQKILNQKRFIPWILEQDKKIPVVPWQDFNNRRTFMDLAERLSPDVGIGIVFDRNVDDLSGLDLDDCIDHNGQFNEVAIDAIKLFAKKAFIEISISGTGLHFIFYSHLGASFNSSPIEYYEHGRYFTLSGRVLEEFSTEEIQDCSEELKAFLTKHLPEKLERFEKTKKDPLLELLVEPSLASHKSVLEALSKIDPDISRGEWFKVAAALHAEFEGSHTGFDLFHQWSMNGDKYKSEEDCRALWDSLGSYKGTPITIRTLFDLAKDSAPKKIEFEDETIEASPTPAKRWFSTSDLASKLGPIQWLVKDYFEANTIGILWGDTQAFKSFISIELCFCVASGIPWHDHEVEKGSVLYICGEGSNGIARRVEGLKSKYQVKEDIPLYVSSGSRDMINEEAIQEVLKFGQSLKEPVKLIVVDTVNRNFSGEENSARDVSLAFKHLDILKNKFGCTVLLAHHTIKNGTSIRGSAAWQQNVDASYEIKRSGKTLFTTISSIKMKDATLPDEIHLKLEERIIGETEEGEFITTLITEKVEEIPEQKVTNREESGVTSLILQCLEKAEGPLKRKDIVQYVVENGKSDSYAITSLKRLVKSGEVIQNGNGTYKIG